MGAYFKARIFHEKNLSFSVYFLPVKDSVLVKGVFEIGGGGLMDSKELLNLYKKQAKMTYFYLRKNGCAHEDAEDIVQESYKKYILYSSGVAADKALSYIFTIALNDFRKRMRTRGREEAISINNDYFWNHFSNEDSPESRLLDKEKREKVRKTLEETKESFRILLILKYEMELSYEEISLLLGMKIETIRTYLYRARNEFKEIWGDLHGGI